MSYRKTTLRIEGEGQPFEIGVGIDSVASRPERPQFNIINKETGNQVDRVYVDPETGEEVPDNQQWKAYELGDEQLEFPSDAITKIKRQVKENEINARTVIDQEHISLTRARGSYYLSPQEDNETEYSVLNEALNESGKALIATYSFQGQPRVFALWSDGDGIIMTKLAFQDDLREHTATDSLEKNINNQHVDKAIKLLEQADHGLPDVKDTYRDKVEDMLTTVAEEGDEAFEDLVDEQVEDAEEQELDDALDAALGGDDDDE